MHEIEVWVLVDEDGDFVVAKDAADLAERYDDEIGSDSAAARRVVKVTLKVDLPSHVELTGEAPAVGAAQLQSVS
jgi:hypothetical protein